MPGPGAGGGGGRAGGGFGGGFGGGGFGGGGGYRGGGFGFFPMFYGGGCLGGVLSFFMLPLILLLVGALILFGVVGGAFATLISGGNIVYNEAKISDYADMQYAEIYGAYSAYEDNIVLVIATDSEEYWDYAYIAWVGDHLSNQMYYAFDSTGTLDVAIARSINASYYKYSLDTDLARMVETMTAAVKDIPALKCNEVSSGAPSRFVNKTEDIATSSETVEAALAEFTAETGIPFSIVIDEAEDIFGKTFSASDIISIVIAVGLIVFAVIWIVRKYKDKNGTGGGDWYSDSTKKTSNDNYWR